MAYSMQNILIFEELNLEKTQSLKNDVNDPIKEVKLSPNGDLLLIYTRDGRLDGFPQIIVYNSQTRRKVSHITIDDQEIVAVEFSNYSNMLLVISYNGNDANPRSTIAIWDFMDGRREYLCKSVVPFLVYDARWNPYIKTSSDEFVTISDQKYQYWRITQNLQMQYQDGARPPKAFQGEDAKARFTSLSFVEPMLEQNSVYLLIGLSNGDIWVLDTKTNHFINSTKVLDCAIGKMVSSVARIVVEGLTDTSIRAWELKKTIADFDYDASDPGYFFAGPEKKL